MKCICKYLLVFALGTSLASCSDFLDMTPDEVLTLDDVFNNRIYTRNFLTHIYSWTPTEANMADSGGAWRNPYTGGCDEMEIAFGGAYSHQINNGGWNPSNIKDTQVWPESYMAIRKVNQFLENVDRCPTSDTEKTIGREKPISFGPGSISWRSVPMGLFRCWTIRSIRARTCFRSGAPRPISVQNSLPRTACGLMSC